MPSKRQLLSNVSSKWGPESLAGFGGARALVLGKFIDLTGIPDLRSYFSVIIAEDPGYALGLVQPADVEIWQPGSPYVDSVYSFPIDQDLVYVVNYRTLSTLGGLQKQTGTYNIAYLPSFGRGVVPTVERGVRIGLDELATGVHLAEVMGAVEIWDTEGRSGTTEATVESITDMTNDRNIYGISNSLLGERLALVDLL